MNKSKSIAIGIMLATTFLLTGCGDDFNVKIKDLTNESRTAIANKMTDEEKQLYTSYIERNSQELMLYNAQKDANIIMGKKVEMGEVPKGLDTNITVREAINAERKLQKK